MRTGAGNGWDERRGSGRPLVTRPDGTPEGVDAGHVLGTHWHGLLENDAFRRRLLGRVADLSGRAFVPAPDTEEVKSRRPVLTSTAPVLMKLRRSKKLGKSPKMNATI